MNLRYQVRIGNNPAVIFYEFHPKTKAIRAIRIESDAIELHQVKWLMQNAPKNEQDLINNFASKFGKKIYIVFAPQNISFDDFWNKFNNKVGNKPRAKKLWGLLSDVDQMAAFTYIETYNAHLRSNPSLTKLYPETYLSQERWKE